MDGWLGKFFFFRISLHTYHRGSHTRRNKTRRRTKKNPAFVHPPKTNDGIELKVSGRKYLYDTHMCCMRHSLSEGARAGVWDNSLRHKHVIQYPELQRVEDPAVKVLPGRRRRRWRWWKCLDKSRSAANTAWAISRTHHLKYIHVCKSFLFRA